MGLITEPLEPWLQKYKYKFPLEIVKRYPYIAGGAMVRLIRNEPPADFDFYRAKDLDIWTPDQIPYSFTKGYKELKISPAYTYNFIYDNYKLQVPSVVFKSVQELFTSFDLTCCKLATDGTNIIADEEGWNDLLNGEFSAYSQKKSIKSMLDEAYDNLVGDSDREYTPEPCLPLKTRFRAVRYMLRGFIPKDKETIENIRYELGFFNYHESFNFVNSIDHHIEKSES